MTMRPDELHKGLLERGYDRLEGVFGPSAKLNRDGWVWAVQAATRGWTEQEFQTAVKVAAAECRYFPRPKDVTERRPLTQRQDAEQVFDLDRCVFCGQQWFYAGFRCADGMVRPRIRCACAQPSDRWDDPEARAWEETDESIVRQGFTRRAA